jgi:hypothetical protein
VRKILYVIFDIVMAGIVSAFIALAAVITLGVRFRIVLSVICDKIGFRGATRSRTLMP